MTMLQTKNITTPKLIICVSIFLTLLYNTTFFHNISITYPLSPSNIPFIASIAVILTGITVISVLMISPRFVFKPLIIIILIFSSAAAYFMNTYNIIIDVDMIQSILETNADESFDLFSFHLVLYILFLGVLPSFIIFKIPVKCTGLKTEIVSRLKIGFLALFLMVALLFCFSRSYTSFFREHKQLRYYTNPGTWIYSLGKYAVASLKNSKTKVTPIGLDANVVKPEGTRKLVILVVGEALRADRLGLNGYYRPTTPLLGKEDVISFTKMYSSATSTAVSVPSMFSIFKRSRYGKNKAKQTENLLDVLRHAGVNVLWRDNNSSSKGTAVRVEYEDFRHTDKNPICDNGECRDVGMLVGLEDYINKKKTGDIFIVLHQMGNHGPAYYRRYPDAFEKFTPVCKTNQLGECTREEINNAYDNCVLYTDYFLSEVITFLKTQSAQFETAMIYMSDHGESLGEKGIYLHGMPYLMAPVEQKHIGSVMWFGDNFRVDKKALAKKSANKLSHDILFHTVLGLMEVETNVYDHMLDIINYDKV